MTDIRGKFNQLKAKVINSRAFYSRTAEEYDRELINPVGIIDRETVAPDFDDFGRIRYFLVIADDLSPEHWPYEDDGSLASNTKGFVLAELDENFELLGWRSSSNTIHNLFFETCEFGGSLEVLSAYYETIRNYRTRVLYHEQYDSEEEQEEALNAARQTVADLGLPDELRSYMDILQNTENPEEYRRVAFEMWDNRELVKKHIVQLSHEMIFLATRGIDSVAGIWLCQQICAFDCPAPDVNAYAILVCQYSLNPQRSIEDGRRIQQWAGIESLLKVTNKLTHDCAPIIVDALEAELAWEHPYHEFIRDAIYVLGAIGNPDVITSIESLRSSYPIAVSHALGHYGEATAAEIKARAEQASEEKRELEKKSGCLGQLFLFGLFGS